MTGTFLDANRLIMCDERLVLEKFRPEYPRENLMRLGTRFPAQLLLALTFIGFSPIDFRPLQPCRAHADPELPSEQKPLEPEEVRGLLEAGNTNEKPWQASQPA